MSLIINALSAVGNNSSVYPLLVRDCAIEVPAKISQTYCQNAKDSKRMAMHATREKILDEYATSAVWMAGVPATEWVANKIIGKVSGLNGKVNLKLLEKDNSGNYKNGLQNIALNIQKFKDKAPEAVRDLERVQTNAGKYKRMANNKYIAALLVPVATMGIIIPKSIFALTNYLIDKDIKNGKLPPVKKDINENNKYRTNETINKNTNFKSLNSIKNNNSNVSFKGFASTVAALSHTEKMAATDIGLGAGRVITSRGQYEKIEKIFYYSGMLLLNFVTPKYIEKGLDKATKAIFGINTALDPKIMADKRFLVKVRNNALKLPDREENVLDFIDNNPNSLFTKYAKKNKIVKFLDNNVRDPREFVDTKKLFSLSENMREFAQNARSGKNGIAKYAQRAIKGKSFNIVTNVALSSLLLAAALPQAQFGLRKLLTGTNIDPGLIATNKQEQQKLNKRA